MTEDGKKAIKDKAAGIKTENLVSNIYLIILLKFSFIIIYQ